MPKLLNTQTGKLVEIPEHQIGASIASGDFSFATGETYRLRDPEGRLVDVSGDAAPMALQRMGYRFGGEEERIQELQQKGEEEYYTSFTQKAVAGAEGLARGATLGLSDVLLGDEETRKRREYSPKLSMATEIGGAVVPALVSGGTATPGLARSILRATPAGLAARAGTGIAATGGIGAAAVGYGLEGALYNGGMLVSDVALGNKELSGEAIVGSLGEGALWGGGIGAAFTGVSRGVGALAKRREQALAAKAAAEAQAAAPAVRTTPTGTIIERLPAGKYGAGGVEAALAKEAVQEGKVAARAEKVAAKTIREKPAPGLGADPLEHLTIPEAVPAGYAAGAKGQKIINIKKVVPKAKRSRKAVEAAEQDFKRASDEAASRGSELERVAVSVSDLNPELIPLIDAYQKAAANFRAKVSTYHGIAGPKTLYHERRVLKLAEDLERRGIDASDLRKAARHHGHEVMERRRAAFDPSDSPGLRYGKEGERGKRTPAGRLYARAAELEPEMARLAPHQRIGEPVASEIIGAGRQVEPKLARAAATEGTIPGTKRALGIRERKTLPMTSAADMATLADEWRFPATQDVAWKKVGAAAGETHAIGGSLQDILAKEGRMDLARAYERGGVSELASAYTPPPRSVVLDVPRGKVGADTMLLKKKPAIVARQFEDDVAAISGFEKAQDDLYRAVKPHMTPEQAARHAEASEVYSKAVAKKKAARGGAFATVQDIAGAGEVLQEVGVNVTPDVERLPAVGGLLGIYLKGRLLRRALGGGIGIAHSPIAEVASRVSGLRDKVSDAVQKFASPAAKAAKGAPKVLVPTTAMILSSPLWGEEKKKDAPAVESMRKRVAELSEAVSRPEVVRRKVREKVPIGDEDLLAEIEKTTARKLQFLYDKAPKDPRMPSVLGQQPREWLPDSTSLHEFAKYMRAADDPTTLLADLEAGRLSPQAVEAVKHVYPTIFAEIQRELIENVSTLRETMPYGKRVQMSVLFEVPIDESLQSQFVRYMQEGYTPQEAQPNAPTSSTLKFGEMETLATTRRAAR